MEQSKYKTFKDLVFKPWCEARGIVIPGREDDTQAMMEFPNGYAVSVLHGESFYSDYNTYEVAIMKDGEVVYPKGICRYRNVFGFQTARQVTEIMRKVQEL